MAKKVAAKESVAAPRLKPSALVDTRVIYCGDNLEQLGQRLTGTVWGETKEKRACISALRIPHSAFELTGSFYYHCDWHTSQVMRIFGENNFQNRIDL